MKESRVNTEGARFFSPGEEIAIRLIKDGVHAAIATRVWSLVDDWALGNQTLSKRTTEEHNLLWDTIDRDIHGL